MDGTCYFSMKIPFFARAMAGFLSIAVGAIACTSTQTNSVSTQSTSDRVQASTERGSDYFCDKSKDETWTTFARSPRGRLPIIRWESEFFKDSGYTPEKRCKEVSENFLVASQRGILSFITTGMENRQPVVCVSRDNGGPCSMTLWTLKPTDNASEVIQKIFQVGPYAGRPLSQSSSGSSIYIDVKEFLRTAQAEEGN